MFMSFSVHVSISDFLLFVKNGFVVGVRSLKVTARHSNNAGSSYGLRGGEGRGGEGRGGEGRGGEGRGG